MKSHRVVSILMPAALVLALATTGCATKKYVRTEVAASSAAVEERVDARVSDVETDVEQNQMRISGHDEQIAELSETAKDALDRAVAAGKLAEGKLLYERLLTDDQVHFDVDDSVLSPEARSALDEIAAELVADNRNVYIEIQGHTDATGGDRYNDTLGERRADSVRRYLNEEHSIPLHRMSVISYGESAPVADNDTKEGRATNRRVALVVLI